MRISQFIEKPQALSDIFKKIGVVFFASLIISPLFGNSTTPTLLLVGIIFTGLSWIFSLLIARN